MIPASLIHDSTYGEVIVWDEDIDNVRKTPSGVGGSNVVGLLVWSGGIFDCSMRSSKSLKNGSCETKNKFTLPSTSSLLVTVALSSYIP